MFGLARSARKIGNNPMGTASKLKAAIRTAGFRIIACKNGKRVKLYSRPGNDLTYRFPLIVEAVEAYCTLGEISDAFRAVWGEARDFGRI